MKREEAIAALEWLVEMGADEVVGEFAVDRLSAPVSADPSRERKPEIVPQRVEISKVAPSLPMDRGVRRDDVAKRGTGNAVDDAKGIAAACRTLEDIAEALSRFDACPLKRTATHLALCDGNAASAGDVHRRSAGPR